MADVAKSVRTDVKLKVDCDGLGLDAQQLQAIQNVANRHGIGAWCGGAKGTVLEVDATQVRAMVDAVRNAPQAHGEFGPLTNKDGSPKIALNRKDLETLQDYTKLQYQNEARASGLTQELQPLVRQSGLPVEVVNAHQIRR